MILTVTLNPALDWVTFIDEFIPTTVIRARKVVEALGGKGLDTSVALHSLGVSSLALAIAAGENGKRLAGLLDQYGFEYHLVWTEGETRIANVVVETKHHRHTHIMTWGCQVTPRAVEEFFTLFEEHLGKASWVVVAGTMADGFPADSMKKLIEIARRTGVSTMIDSRGEPFQLALQARPTICKMNRAEYFETFGGNFFSMEQLGREVELVRSREKLDSLVITCGADGILAVTPQGVFLGLAPTQQPVNAAGAGDAVSGALAWRLEMGDDWKEALRWAAATGAATVLTEETAESRPEDVKRILPETVVKSL